MATQSASQTAAMIKAARSGFPNGAECTRRNVQRRHKALRQACGGASAAVEVSFMIVVDDNPDY
jgi:hypothetical protein